jgi:hypothetical protein
MQGEYAQLLALRTDNPDLSRPDGLIDVDCGLSYDATS